jgi:hypothetical protein
VEEKINIIVRPFYYIQVIQVVLISLGGFVYHCFLKNAFFARDSFSQESQSLASRRLASFYSRRFFTTY